MKIVKYHNQIVKCEENIVIKPEPPVELTYSTHSLKYSSNNCAASCGDVEFLTYYCEIDVVTISVDDVIYSDNLLTQTVLSGYYSDNTWCHWVDGDGIVTLIEPC